MGRLSTEDYPHIRDRQRIGNTPKSRNSWKKVENERAHGSKKGKKTRNQMAKDAQDSARAYSFGSLNKCREGFLLFKIIGPACHAILINCSKGELGWGELNILLPKKGQTYETQSLPYANVEGNGWTLPARLRCAVLHSMDVGVEEDDHTRRPSLIHADRTIQVQA